ncbi:glycoside hydrolase family 28 protein [Treponema sp.]|uniref:glycoside hydrolase family 28 protein n=1 Tax=Treponema sp. TaxID=166 RepID=UPI003FD74438
MKEFFLEDFGGKNDGVFNNVNAFAMAFMEISRNGGGKLTLKKGNYLTGPIDIPSNTTLFLEEGCELSFVTEPTCYPPVYTRWEGVECFAMHPLIFSRNTKNVSITGKGTLNGNGEPWWALAHAKRNDQMEPVEPYEKLLASMNPDHKNQPGGGGGRESQFLRPSFVEFSNCENVTIEGIKIINSPFWTVHPLYVNNLTLKDLYIENPYEAPNTDGIDIDSCQNVKILNCFVSVGDDGICLKSGSGPDGIRCNVPTKNVLIKNCTVRFAHGGLVVGSETAAGIFNVTAEDCDLDSTDRGIRIKSRRGRGGALEGIHLKNISMNNTLCPLSINMFYSCGEYDPSSPLFSLEKQPVTKETPTLKDVSIIGVKAQNCRASAGLIACLPEVPVENLLIQDCEFSTDEKNEASPMQSDMFFGLPEITEKSFRILNAPDAVFKNVKVSGPKEPFIFR